MTASEPADLHLHLRRLLAAAAGAASDAELQAIQLSPPKNRAHGDAAFGTFALAKLRGVAPPQLAANLAAAARPDEVGESVTAAGPFVNARFRRSALARHVVLGVLRGDAPFARAASSGKSIVIDFSSPNIAKPFHMGHLRSTVIGAAIGRIWRHLGAEVHGINHLGDWGMPFAKMMTAWMHWGDQKELEKSPMRHMFELYKLYSSKAKENPALDDEAAAHIRALESGADNEERRMWQFLRDESLAAFQGPYDRLGVTFDHITGESFFEDKMEAAMARVAAAGVLEVDDGAEVVKLDSLGIKVPCILRKSDGTTLYHTRDLAAAFWREAQYHPDRILYVVGAEQKLHFEQLAAVLARMGEPLAKKVEHVPFGLILAKNEETGKWEKFASRGGNAIFLDEVLDEAVANVRRIITEKNPELADADRVAEQVGVSAIVFNDLKNSRIKDVKFDWEQMLNFDGETGPYVQFAAARLSGILRKSDVALDAGAELAADLDGALLADAEDVLLTMLDFGATLERAAEQSEPSIVTGFAIQLAGSIHAYLREHHVLRAEPALRDARLALVAAARRLLHTSLGLLGVAAPDEM
ncbi:MAG: arginine--tRNA ligase [Planctomycetes bacterium]|nr:arginine--tRNA ligase [Planctomycetota bacterium]